MQSVTFFTTILAEALPRPWFLNFGGTMATRTICEDYEVESG